VNCGAIPAELLESELFGHEKGAFTGAICARKGRFEVAEGGTLFLDEIGDMSPTMQVKLLRVLQERVFERVGNHVPMRCNVRIIAATHRNLEESMARATFREDLFHRLNVFPIEMPALRSRLDDLPLLIRDFAAHNVAEGRSEVQLAPRALAALALCPWPGNVRELANLIERLSIVTAGRVAEVGDLPVKYRPAGWSTQWVAPQFASEIAALDTTVAERIRLDGDILPPGTQLLATNDVVVEYDANEDPPRRSRFAQRARRAAEKASTCARICWKSSAKLVMQALERSDGVVARRSPARPAPHDPGRETAQARAAERRRRDGRLTFEDAPAAENCRVRAALCDRSLSSAPVFCWHSSCTQASRCIRACEGRMSEEFTVAAADAAAYAPEVSAPVAAPATRDEGARSVELVACAPGSRRLADLARRVAGSDCTVLIVGESGTGKEVLARFVHRHSTRANKPFVAVNCAAIPETMLEAMLFGYERGAFTGAHATHAGKFEQAQGGTLLLDEVTEMPLSLQAKLLRVLQEREVERLGGRTPVALDVRVLATTNRRLREEVSAGRFREDLYYRLNVFPLAIAPLSMRRDDVLPLAMQLLASRVRPGSRIPALSADAAHLLLTYNWPGNVRELDNLLQRALILVNGPVIEPEHIQFELLNEAGAAAGATAGAAALLQAQPAHVTTHVSAPAASANDCSLASSLGQAEKDLILEALRTGSPRHRVAERLGISPRTLRHKLARLREAGVEVPAA
jgi:two-component system response regulator FlrC